MFRVLYVSIKFIANEPWAISENGLQLVVAVASKDDFFAQVRERALSALNGEPLKNTRETTVRGDVAIVPVTGPLFRHANLMTDLSGATSYAALRRDLQVAVDDQSIREVLLDIDSPGGEAKGVSEFASSIVELRKRKRIRAYVGGTGASAAYWIASACDEIVCSDTAQLGSIGVIAAYQKSPDDDTIEIRSSQSPYKALSPDTDEGKARIQARIDALADVFIDAVAKNRGVSSQTVMSKFGKGDVMVGAHAVKAGLADRLGSFESLIAEMTSPLVKFGRETVARAKSPSVGISLLEFGRMEVGL